jgi:hypothetical protein
MKYHNYTENCIRLYSSIVVPTQLRVGHQRRAADLLAFARAWGEA